MGSGGVAIAALPTVICLKVPFSDGLGGGKIKGIKWLFYFSFLLKMITFAVYFYPLLHRDGTVQILQNLLVRIIYHGIV